MTDLKQLQHQMDTQGWFIARQVLSPENIATVKDRLRYIIQHRDFYDKYGIICQENEAYKKDEGNRTDDPLLQFNNVVSAHMHDEIVLKNTLHTENMMALVESQIGPDYCTNGGSFFLKPPHYGTEVAWHQDSRTWVKQPRPWPPEETPRLFDTWIAFDHATKENGCLQLLPGSEKHGILPNRKRGDTDLGNGFGDDPDSMGLSESDTVHCIMEPGDVAVWHQDMSHYSEPNRSDKPRLGLSLSLVAAADIPRVRPHLVQNRYVYHGYPICIGGKPAPIGNAAPEFAN